MPAGAGQFFDDGLTEIGTRTRNAPATPMPGETPEHFEQRVHPFTTDARALGKSYSDELAPIAHGFGKAATDLKAGHGSQALTDARDGFTPLWSHAHDDPVGTALRYSPAAGVLRRSGGITSKWGHSGDAVVDHPTSAGGPGSHIDLYHGTSADGARNIVNKGINPLYTDLHADFGQGFYTTTHRDIAQARVDRYKEQGAPGAILHYRVPEKELNELRGKTFPSPNQEWQDFVRAGRTNGGPPHDYDWIRGPLLFKGDQWMRGEIPLRAGKEQTVFYTPESFELLSRSLHGIHY